MVFKHIINIFQIYNKTIMIVKYQKIQHLYYEELNGRAKLSFFLSSSYFRNLDQENKQGKA